MNRRDLQNLADIRLREAQSLYRAKEFSGAYYLAGYFVELAFKACIAKTYRRYDFPAKKLVNDSHTHDLRKLAVLAGLEPDRLARSADDELFRKNWDIITLWSEESRYRTTDQSTCSNLLGAIMDEDHGLLPWIKALW